MWKSWKRRALAENKTDYSKYRFSWQEYLLCFFKAFFATGAFTGMFYRSWLGMLAFPAVWKVLYGRDKKNRIQKRKERLSLQFKDTILMVTAGIQAGSSIENAFLDVEREISVLYGQNSEMGQELALIRKGLTNRCLLYTSVDREEVKTASPEQEEPDLMKNQQTVYAAENGNGEYQEDISRVLEESDQWDAQATGQLDTDVYKRQTRAW